MCRRKSCWDLTVLCAAILGAFVHTPARAQEPPGTKVPTYVSAMPAPHITVDADLDAGFGLLYELKFGQARETFAAWETGHPDQPLGYALEAAADLFEQFYRKGVLTSDFFLDDKRFLGGIDGEPDRELEQRFQNSAQRGEQIAHAQLADRSGDPDALFALTLVAGMRADNDAVIDKRQIESLHFIRESDRWPRELLAAAPDSEDAYLALGAANYIIGSLPTYKRAFLWVGGIHGDKAVGLQQLSRAATKGHYLRPYAELLLALAALREKNTALARTELSGLVVQFPGNPLFAAELAKVAVAIGSGASRPGSASVR